ncbi:MAG TPA: hypothetical protein GXX29_05115 [Firmicutes bacterium]|nr:hypothetical protein [Bacillota bacterium]
MEFACARCGGVVTGGRCEECAQVYVTCCAECGNNIMFEQVDASQGQSLLRCTVCQNDFHLHMQVMDNRRDEWFN